MGHSTSVRLQIPKRKLEIIAPVCQTSGWFFFSFFLFFFFSFLFFFFPFFFSPPPPELRELWSTSANRSARGLGLRLPRPRGLDRPIRLTREPEKPPDFDVRTNGDHNENYALESACDLESSPIQERASAGAALPILESAIERKDRTSPSSPYMHQGNHAYAQLIKYTTSDTCTHFANPPRSSASSPVQLSISTGRRSIEIEDAREKKSNVFSSLCVFLFFFFCFFCFA